MRKSIVAANEMNYQQSSSPGKVVMIMQRDLYNYIDNIIIRDNAEKCSDYYALHVAKLSDNEKAHLLDRMFRYDSQTIEWINERMQELIDERIDIVFSQDQYDSGLVPVMDRINGEISWIKG